MRCNQDGMMSEEGKAQNGSKMYAILARRSMYAETCKQSGTAVPSTNCNQDNLVLRATAVEFSMRKRHGRRRHGR